MKARGTIRVCMLMLSICICFVIGNKLCQQLLYASHVAFSFDQSISKNQQEKIIFTVRHAGFNNPQEVAYLIKEKCAAIQDVSIIRKPNQQWHMIIDAQKPMLMINHCWILGSLGHLIHRKFYNKVCIKDLPKITVDPSNSQPTLSVPFKKWLGTLSQEQFAQYSIQYRNDYEVIVRQKNNTSFALLTSCLEPLSDHTLLACKAIYQGLCDAGSEQKKSSAPFNADIRFDKQIVLIGALGGKNHG